MSDDNNKLPALNAWGPEVLRLTVFVMPDVLPDMHIDWWGELLGVEPDSVNTQPKAGKIEISASLPEQNCTLKYTAQPERIDWYLGPLLKQDSDPEDLPVIGDFESSLEFFTPLVLRWLTNYCPGVWRLAFGCILLQRVEDKQDGYRLLNRYLPAVELDPENSSDFLYTINRPRPSKAIPERSITRLSKWSIVRAQGIYISAIGDMGALRHPLPARFSACRLELDINNKPVDTTELPADRLQALYSEYVEFAKEIASSGDIV